MNKELFLQKLKKVAEFIFFSNYFYGICAIGLSIEASLQQRFPMNGFTYFFLVFISTVFYYSHPYIRTCPVISSNPRTNWYNVHYRLMRWSQKIIAFILIISLAVFLVSYWNAVWTMPVYHWLMIIIFPVVGALYYGINFFSAKYNVRKIGWLKPFIIGFTWAGLV